jgi:CheY-like chemotaxis protein
MPKILLVEDNEMNLDMLTRRLQRRGFTMLAATDGQQALTLAASESPDLILMDLSLPGLDGWEATRRLKADPLTSSIPIIALTANAMAQDEQKARESGCNDFDTKPIELPRLLAKMESLLKTKPSP